MWSSRDALGVRIGLGSRREIELIKMAAQLQTGRGQLLGRWRNQLGHHPSFEIALQRIVEHLIDRDIGVLITDHNVRETLGICHHAYILNEGTVLAEGTPDEIQNDSRVIDAYLGAH